MRKLLYILLLFGSIVQAQFSPSIGVIASQGEAAPITNYVFDGGATSFFEDEAVTATLLDGVVSQTWVIRMEIAGASTQRGILGAADGVTGLIKLEIDASDNQVDGKLADTGISSFINADVSLDTGFNTYFFQYDGVNIEFYKGSTSLRTTASAGFTARTAGSHLTIGQALQTDVFNGKISDVQFYSAAFTAQMRTDVTSDITDIQPNLVANFAGGKTLTTWTSENTGSKPNYVMTNQGGVTTE